MNVSYLSIEKMIQTVVMDESRQQDKVKKREC